MDTPDIESDFADELPANTVLSPRMISGFWRRIIAFVLDCLCLGLAGVILGIFIFDSLAHLGGWGRVLGFGITLIYFGILNSTLGQGQTIGKGIMKIKVVDRTGNYISLKRSFLRYAVLGIPFFLNNAMIPPRMMRFPTGALINIIIFGISGSIFYLYIFNRRTRQSLHDLAIGSFVTKKNFEGHIAGSIWRFHLVMTIVWIAFVFCFSFVLTGLTQKKLYSELLSVQSAIQSAGNVHAVSVFDGKGWISHGGKKQAFTYFSSNAFWKERPKDYDKAAQQVASIIIQNYDGIMNRDFLVVKISYGYDIGISRGWTNHTYRYRLPEWQKILGESLEYK